MSEKMEMYELHLSWIFRNVKAIVRVGGNAVRVETKKMLLGLIPIGTRNETIQLRNITSVVVNTRIRIGSLILAVLFAITAFTSTEGLGQTIFALIIAALFAISVPNTVLTISKNDGVKIEIDILANEKGQAEVLKSNIEELMFKGQ